MFLRLFLVDLALDLFDERQDVAHTKDPLGNTVGIKRFDRVVLFADADKLDRLADDLLDREGSTAAGVAVHLGQHDPGDADTLVKHLSRANSILPGHRVRDEEHLDGFCLGLDLFELDHQLVVNVQSPGRVDHQRVKAELGRVLDGTANDRHRIAGLFCLVNRYINGICDNLELFARRRTIDVDRDEKRLSLLIVRQPPRDLTGRCGLTRALQADDHHDVRRGLGKNKPRGRAAHQLGQFVVNDLDHLLVGFEVLPNGLALSLGPYGLDKIFCDLIIYVCLEQRHPDLAERSIDVLGR